MFSYAAHRSCGSGEARCDRSETSRAKILRNVTVRNHFRVAELTSGSRLQYCCNIVKNHGILQVRRAVRPPEMLSNVVFSTALEVEIFEPGGR